MATIDGVFVNSSTGKPQDGASAKLWPSSAFSSPPAKNTALPSSGQVGSTVTTGASHGSDGAYRFLNVPAGDYYISVEYNGNIGWEAARVESRDHADNTSGNVHPQYAPVASDMRTFNVRAYGALGNETNNDAPAFQAALDAAEAAGGGTVWASDGDYRMEDALHISANTHLLLSKGARILRYHVGRMLDNGPGNVGTGYNAQPGNIIVEGGIWDARGTVETNSTNAMFFDHAENIIIRDLEVRDVSTHHAVDMPGVKNAKVINCRFLGRVDNAGGTSNFREAVQVDLTSADDQTASYDMEVRGCYFGASGTVGTTAWPRGVGSHTAVAGSPYKNLRISDNHFVGMTQFAMSFVHQSRAVITGNTFEDCGGGVRFQNISSPDPTAHVYELVIANNVFNNMTGYGEAVRISGESSSGLAVGVSITDNVIKGVTSQRGICVLWSDGLSIAGNIIRDAGNDAIFTQECSNPTVAGNTIKFPIAHGIAVDAGSRASITGNNIYAAGENGIMIGDVTGVPVFVVNSNLVSESDRQGISVEGSTFGVVADNFVQNSSEESTGTYNNILIASSSTDITLSGNRTRVTNGKTQYSLAITGTCARIKRFGNAWDNGTAGNVSDVGTSGDTTATDANI
jgi:polygalacturonase